MADYYYKMTVGELTVEVGFSHYHELMDYIRALDGPVMTHAVPCSHPLAERQAVADEAVMEADNEIEDPMWIVGTYHVNSKNKRVTKFLALDGKKWCWTTKRALAKEFGRDIAINYSCPTPIPMEKCHRATVLES